QAVRYAYSLVLKYAHGQRNCCRLTKKARKSGPFLAYRKVTSGHAWAHLAQPFDPLLDRGVGREEAGKALGREGLDDVERLGRLVDLHRHRRRTLLEAQQGTGQRLRVAADFGAAGVGRVLALARDRQLDDRGGDRRQQE